MTSSCIFVHEDCITSQVDITIKIIEEANFKKSDIKLLATKGCKLKNEKHFNIFPHGEDILLILVKTASNEYDEFDVYTRKQKSYFLTVFDDSPSLSCKIMGYTVNIFDDAMVKIVDLTCDNQLPKTSSHTSNALVIDSSNRCRKVEMPLEEIENEMIYFNVLDKKLLVKKGYNMIQMQDFNPLSPSERVVIVLVKSDSDECYDVFNIYTKQERYFMGFDHHVPFISKIMHHVADVFKDTFIKLVDC